MPVDGVAQLQQLSRDTQHRRRAAYLQPPAARAPRCRGPRPRPRRCEGTCRRPSPRPTAHHRTPRRTASLPPGRPCAGCPPPSPPRSGSAAGALRAGGAGGSAPGAARGRPQIGARRRARNRAKPRRAGWKALELQGIRAELKGTPQGRRGRRGRFQRCWQERIRTTAPPACFRPEEWRENQSAHWRR